MLKMILKQNITALIFQIRTMLSQSNILIIRTGVNLSYKVIGKGTTESEEPPIFLLHGLLGRKKQWKSIGKIIRNLTRRSVVIVDLRNHGGSPNTSSQKYDEMAVDIVQLLDKLEIQKASLIGQCIGGRAAMCTSLIAPERVAGLIVVDISPVSTPEQLKDMLLVMMAMKAMDFKNLKNIGKAKIEAKKQLKDFILDDITINDIVANLNVNSDGKIGWTCNLGTLIRHFHHITSFPKSLKGKTYNGPCLFIGGQLSEYLPADDLTNIRVMFPQAVITYIPKTGHNLHAEDTKTFLELAIAFLKANN